MSFYENFLMVLIIIIPRNLIKTDVFNYVFNLKLRLKAKKHLLLIFVEQNEMIEF